MGSTSTAPSAGGQPSPFSAWEQFLDDTLDLLMAGTGVSLGYRVERHDSPLLPPYFLYYLVDKKGDAVIDPHAKGQQKFYVNSADVYTTEVPKEGEESSLGVRVRSAKELAQLYARLLDLNWKEKVNPMVPPSDSPIGRYLGNFAAFGGDIFEAHSGDGFPVGSTYKPTGATGFYYLKIRYYPFVSQGIWLLKFE